MKLKHILIAQFILLIVLPYQSAFGQSATTLSDCIGTSVIQRGTLFIDQDGDGLIEICTPAGLNNIRNRSDGLGYSVDGESYNSRGCDIFSGCMGYELGNDINLQEIENWEPIENFSTTLEGNGFSISNLTINRGNIDSVGLFVGNTGTIRNLVLSTIEVTGGTRVGGLVGVNQSRLINIHVEGGTVRGEGGTVGLLTGRNDTAAFIVNSSARGTATARMRWAGGISGVNSGSIINSYADAMVTALGDAGGFVGENVGSIINSYSMGSAHITESEQNNQVVGGFVAGLFGSGSIRNSYSAAIAISPRGNNNIRTGGLIGNRFPVDLDVENSYWDSTVIKGVTTTAGLDGTPQTTEALTMPTAPGEMQGDVYYQWSTDDWDFGSPIQYPVLKYYSTDTTVLTSCDSSEDTALPQCGTLLPGQGTGLRNLQILTENARLATDFSSTTTLYVVEVATNTTELQLQLTRYDYDAAVTVQFGNGQGTTQSITLSSGENQPTISIDLGTTIDIMIKDTSASTLTYALTVKYPDIVLQKGITIEGSANEGETLTLSLPDDAIGGGSGNSENYTYQWEYQPSDPSQLRNPTLELSNTTSSIVTVDIPADFVARDYDQSDVVFTVTVSEADSMASAESIVTIIKQNNSDTTLDVDLGFVDGPTTTSFTITVSASDEDGDITSDEDGYDSRFRYAWQSLALDDTQWRTIATETTSNTMTTYEIAKGSTPTLRYRVELSYTDAQGHTTTTQFGTFRTDVDIDDDGLVEIYYLEDLDAIRDQPDGAGYLSTLASDIVALNSLGCDEDGAGTCSGYEIARHLDFRNDAHYQDIKNKAIWTTGEGWSPIDNLVAVLEGNGNTISSLYVKRNQAGLFSSLASSGLIRNLGLLEVNVGIVLNVQLNISGTNDVGGFVSDLGGGSIINSYISGSRGSSTINGNERVGGLASIGNGRITNSYAKAFIASERRGGGLYGSGNASIDNSYLRGRVSGPFLRSVFRVGAMAGETRGNIDNSYAASTFRGNLIGWGTENITDSYARVPLRHNELKEPTEPSTLGLYNGWRTERWDFGTSRQFPILKYFEHCSSEPQTKRTDPPQCDTFLPDQDDGLRDLEIMNPGIALDGDQIFASEDSNYAVSFSNNTPNLKLRLKAYDSDSQISVFRHGDETDYFAGTRDDADVSLDIPLGNAQQTTVTIMVREVFPETENEYTLALVNRTLRVSEEIDVTGDVTELEDERIFVNEGRSFTLAPEISDGIGTVSYEWTAMLDPSQLLNPNLVLSNTSSQTLTVSIPPDFIARNFPSSNVLFSVKVRDNASSATRTIRAIINKIDNDNPPRDPRWVIDGVSLTAVAGDIDDMDGNPGEGDITYQWRSSAIDSGVFIDIGADEGGTSVTYTPRAEYPITLNYRVRIQYMDAQGNIDAAFSDPTPDNYRPDIDIDNDRLIEIYYLEDLNAVRYQLDGTGYRPTSLAEAITAGCGLDNNEVCRGYELIRDLDFNADNSYSSTANKVMWQPNAGKSNAGWRPIGSTDATASTATMIFDGNGYAISNLYQNTTAYSGLFGNIQSTQTSPSVIYNVGLLDVDIQTGGGDNGGLIAACRNCLIANSYVTGTLSPQGSAVDTLGGLVGRATSDDTSVISYQNIYAQVDFDLTNGSATNSGRLLGLSALRTGNAYARGRSQETYDGAMVGRLSDGFTSGSLSRVYATGTTIAADNSSFVFDSYTAQDVSILKMPTTPSTIIETDTYYEGWSKDDWDFGTSEQLPILKYNKSSNPGYIACSVTQSSTPNISQPRCNTFLPDQNDGLRDLEIVSAGIRLDKPFASEVSNYIVSFGNETPSLELALRAYEDDSQISVFRQGDSTDYFGDSISLENLGETAITINVREVFPETETQYMLNLVNRMFVVSGEIGITGDITIDDTVITTTEGRIFTLEAPQFSGGSRAYNYTWTAVPEDPSQLLNPDLLNSILSDTSAETLTVEIPPNFIGRNRTTSNVVFNLTVDDPNTMQTTAQSITLTVIKIDNDTPERNPMWMRDGVSLTAVEDIQDLDGNPGEGDINYQWESKAIGADESEWTPIEAAEGGTAVTYTPRAEYPITLNYRVGISYTDAQNYERSIAFSDPTPDNYRSDIDIDNDDLIEIYYLEDLNAIRNQLDGSSYRTAPTAEVITAGCGLDNSGACRGYELMRDLDFDDDDSYADTTNMNIWTANAGWVPIGSNSSTTVTAPMMLQGNGYTISNLYQNTAYSGLFGNIENTAADPLVIYNIGLLDVDIQAQGGDSGGLVAACGNCLIAHSYVTGDLEAVGEVDTMGGLVGRAISDDTTTAPNYRNVYTRVDFDLTGGSATDLGHLLGLAVVRVDDVYARGYDQDAYKDKGGFVGRQGSSSGGGNFRNIYATGNMIAVTKEGGSETSSYATQDIATLKLPTSPTTTINGIVYYENWSKEDWDFGTSEQYPILKYKTYTNEYQACSDPDGPRTQTDPSLCDTFLPDQGIGLRDLIILEPKTLRVDNIFASDRTQYTAWIRNGVESIELELRGYDSEAIITTSDGGTAIGSTMTTIALPNDTTRLDIVATDSVRTAYTLDIRKIATITGTRNITIEAELDEDGTVNEGSTITLTPDIVGGTYQWQSQSDELRIPNPNNRTITVRVPGNFVPADATTRNTILRLTVDDPVAEESVVIDQAFIINRINNGLAMINFRGSLNSRRLTVTVGDDPDGNPTQYQYQWQSQAPGSDSWTTVETEMTASNIATYDILEDTPTGTRYRVEVQYTDEQGYPNTRIVGNHIFRDSDNDDDDDGFIDIYYLEELAAIQPIGNYELRRNLDFNDPDSYANTANMSRWAANDDRSNEGWNPISVIQGEFEGNGYTISNLYINRPSASRVALFAWVLGIIRNVGLVNVNIRGDSFSAGLVAYLNGGRITSSHVTGSVDIISNNDAGGLFAVSDRVSGMTNNSYVIATTGTGISSNGGFAGGLASSNSGTIRNSRADVKVRGATNVGGLIGRNNGEVSNSFARGSVTLLTTSGVLEDSKRVGGLIGNHLNSPVINSYATGDISGDTSRLGGLIGFIFINRASVANSYTISKVTPLTNVAIDGLIGNAGSNPDASYWNSDRYTGDDIRPADDGNQRTTMQLQSPIDADGIYQQWSPADWDFGDEMNYPMLRYDNSLCNSSTRASGTARCGPLPNQQYQTGLGALFVLSDGEELNPDLNFDNQPFSVLRQNYIMGFLNNLSEVQLRPFAVNDDAEIRIIDARDNQNYFIDSGQVSEPISLDFDIPTTVSVVVTDNDINTTYTLVINQYEIQTESTVVDEGETITLNTTTIGDELTWSSTPVDLIDISSGQGTATLQVTIPDDYVQGGADTRTAPLIFEVDIVDGGITYTPRIELTVNKVNNGMPPDIALDLQDSPTTLRVVIVGQDSDSDGIGTFLYTWERLRINEEDEKVSNSPEYRVPDITGSNRYRVSVMHTDGQGYTTDYADRDAFILGTQEPFIGQAIPINLAINDDNGDGLIEIYYLEDLDAIREHLTEMPETCGQNSNELCQGYELQRSLDFRSDASYIGDVNPAWITGRGELGWQPIGDIDNRFNAVFTASTDTLFISNLNINRREEDNIGLFGVIGPRAQLLDIQLVSPAVIGQYAVGALAGLTSRETNSDGEVIASSLIANSSAIERSGNTVDVDATHAWAGGLVGSNYGSIVNSYTQVTVRAKFAAGGLAGYSFGPISDSYALNAIADDGNSILSNIASGGLVGYNHSEAPFEGGGSITNSFATSVARGVFDVGGLVGNNDGGTIDNSYALGDVVGSTNVGGLVGNNGAGTIINGYAGNNVVGAYNIGDLVGTNINGGTFTELSSPPTLVYTNTLDNNGYSSCVARQTDYRVKLPICGTPLPRQNSARGTNQRFLTSLTLSVGTLEPPFDPTIDFSYELVDIPTTATEITVAATVNRPDASVQIRINRQEAPFTFSLEGRSLFFVRAALGGGGTNYRITIPTQPNLSDELKGECDESSRDRGLIEICDLEDLYEIHAHLDGIPNICGESSNGVRNDVCRGYELTRDLDFTDVESYRNPETNKPLWTEGNGWRPIGNRTAPFNAEFNATTASYSIANLMINRTGIFPRIPSDYAGLFGHTGPNARIINLRLPSADVRSRYLAGGLVGHNQGTIINSHVGSVADPSTIIANTAWNGGLVGANAGLINNSYTYSNVISGSRLTDGNVTVISLRGAGFFIGGLAGINSGQIINSISEGSVQGATFAGGLVGVNAGNIDNSYATATVRNNIDERTSMTRRNFYYAGGLVGLNVGSINNTYALGDIFGHDRVGGLVGDNRNLIASSYVTGSNADGIRLVGELVGINTGRIIDSYADRSQNNHALVDQLLPVGMIMNSAISEMPIQSLSSISGWSVESWDLGTNKQHPALRYLQSEVDLPDCELCGTLLRGQAPRPVFSLTVPTDDQSGATVIETIGGYIVRVGLGLDRVRLIPLIEGMENTTITYTYRVDSGVEQTTDENGQPFMNGDGKAFTAMLTPNSREIIITMHLDEDSDETITYFADIHNTIHIQIKVLPEGLLTPVPISP